MKKFIFEGVLPTEPTRYASGIEMSVEDSGMARIVTFSNGNSKDLFVRLQSGSDEVDPITDNYIHAEYDSMAGKKVRITVEVID